MAQFTPEQVNVLLRPLNPARVERRSQAGMTLSYINQADMRAHAIRLFGFGNFDIETLDARLVFEDQNDSKRWNVGYLATVQVTIRDPHGEQVCRYSESAVGTSTQPQRGEAHDMAIKTATSDAMKRCFINIGDQGGLGLYNSGSTAPFVGTTLVGKGDDPEVVASTGSAPTEEDSGQSLATLSDTGEALLAGLRLIEEEGAESSDRILRIARMKSDARWADALTEVAPEYGVTLGVLADRVAATGKVGQ